MGGSSKNANSTTFNRIKSRGPNRERDLKNIGSFTRAALPNMSRDNSERRGKLPNFMSRDNSARQAGSTTPRGQHVANKGQTL